MGLGSFISGVGDAIASGVADVVKGLNYVGPYVDPLFTPQSTSQHPLTPEQQQAGSGILASTLNPPINHEVEAASQGINWVVDNAVMHPISTAMLQINTQTERGANGGGPNPFFSASDWAKAWHAAQHINPLEALELDSTPGGLANKQSEQAINSPLEYYTPADCSLPPGFKDLSHDAQQQ